MKRGKLSAVALAILALTGCSRGALESDRQVVEQISQFGVQYQVTDNQAGQHGVDCAALGADWAACNRAVIRLTNPGPAITSKRWAIWMSQVHQALRVDSDQFRLTHVVGDLTRLEPTAKFRGIAAGETLEIPLVLEYWQVGISDIMPRWYVTAGEAAPKVLASTDTEDLSRFVQPFGDQWRKNGDDRNVLMTAESRFNKNHDVLPLPAARLRGAILPTPQRTTLTGKQASLSGGVHIALPGLSEAEQQALRQHFQRMGLSFRPDGYPIQTAIAPAAFSGQQAIAGAYRLAITQQGATVTGYDANGVRYGVMSIASLLPAEPPYRLPTLRVEDAPRFPYRGVFLDVGRNFHSKAVVLALLDQMAALKLNRFHFHLSDDEGWRIAIPGLPELTEVGGRRCHDLSEQRCLLPQLGSGPESNNNGSGFYRRSDYIDILRYASARGIEVIPEIDMPAHARAAVVAMEARYQRLTRAGREEEARAWRLRDPSDTSNTTSVQYYDRTSYLNPCLPSSLRFVDKVISEIQAMHREAGVPLTTWHFGGDEAKNIRLGAGYTDSRHPEAGKGVQDLSQQDQPWAKSAVCQALVSSGQVKDLAHLPSWFALKVSQLVHQHGIPRMQAWQDGLKAAASARDFATPRVAVNFWDTLFWGGAESVNNWANKGYEVIISNPDYVYLDFPYEVNPLERGYYWGTRFNDERKIFSFAPDNLPQNAETSVDRDGHSFSAEASTPWPGAFGLSAQLWSETVRTDEQVQSMLFPRLLAVAERSWHRAGWEQDYVAGRRYEGGKTHFVDRQALLADWRHFANLLGQRELARLDNAGIVWRVPPPGGVIRDGVLRANVALPGLPIDWSADGGKQWQRYDDRTPPRVSGAVLIRTSSPDGQRHSRSETVPWH
ncbi:beta-N-acetylhexosaminidase [Pantoea sp. 1.19]|uniref:beta-N-acetylhexosaminidase n=1 Tax=Pantoea sp. 1.19 TaxID=1925589 RepID=UPI000948BA4F|nr:beta-N-acetylhexosaminidase [Pantoea sp. 1.19]